MLYVPISHHASENAPCPPCPWWKAPCPRLLAKMVHVLCSERKGFLVPDKTAHVLNFWLKKIIHVLSFEEKTMSKRLGSILQVPKKTLYTLRFLAEKKIYVLGFERRGSVSDETNLFSPSSLVSNFPVFTKSFVAWLKSSNRFQVSSVSPLAFQFVPFPSSLLLHRFE
jgi:hypothetical protein